MNGQNAALMSRQKIIDEVADDRVWFVPQLGDNATNQGAAARMPFEINRAVKIAGAVDFRPAMGPARLLRPDFDEAKPLFELRVAHDLVAQ